MYGSLVKLGKLGEVLVLSLSCLACLVEELLCSVGELLNKAGVTGLGLNEVILLLFLNHCEGNGSGNQNGRAYAYHRYGNTVFLLVLCIGWRHSVRRARQRIG